MNKEILQKAIDTYGVESQIDVCIEEMSELTKALMIERINDGLFEEDWEYVVEKIADVKIMIEQLVMMFDCKDEVEEQVKFKVYRLKKRLEK